LKSLEKRKEKLVYWFETCNHYHQNESSQGERRTKNHWHSRPKTHPLHATRM